MMDWVLLVVGGVIIALAIGAINHQLVQYCGRRIEAMEAAIMDDDDELFDEGRDDE